MKWVYFGVAILLEIVGTTLLKLSNGNEKWYITILSIASYSLCFWFFSKALKYFDIASAYAMWAGIGIVATALIGFVFFKESISVMKVICIVLILLGTIGLNLLTHEK